MEIIGKGEQKLLKWLDNFEQECRIAKQDVDRDWQLYIDVRKGKQWKSGRSSYKSDVVLNLIDLILERDTGLVTDVRPSISVLARRKELKPNAELLQKRIQSIWDETNFMELWNEMVLFSGMFGSAGVDIIFNPRLSSGYGNIDLQVVDPRQRFYDPWMVRARDIDRQCCGYFTEYILPLEIIKQRWEAGKYVEAEDKYSNYSLAKIQTPQTKQIGPTPLRIGSRKDKQLKSAFPKASIREIYFLDEKINETKNPIQYGNVMVYPGQKFFPGGRHIIRSEHKILIDESNPYWDANKPTEWVDWRKDIESPYGRSEIEVQLNPQKNLNKMAASTIENIVSMGNAWIIADKDALTVKEWAGVRGDEPGLIVKKRVQREFRRDYPPPLPSSGMQMIQLLSQFMEQISGQSEVGAGKRPTQLASGIAMDQLQSQAQVLLRSRARTQEAFLQRIFQKVIARVFQFDTKDRLMNIIGDQGQVDQFEFVRENLIAGHGDVKKAFLDYEFIVTPFSTLSMSKIQKTQLAAQLFQAGVIDDIELLKVVEWPNYEEVNERVNKKKMMAALSGQTEQHKGKTPKGKKGQAPPSQPILGASKQKGEGS